VILEAVSGEPGGPPWKLDLVQHDEDVGKTGLVKEARIRGKIGLIGGEDHGPRASNESVFIH
jgi:hypothetical protein